MTKDEHKQIVDQLLTADSQADRATLLTQLSDDYAQMLGTVETAQTETKRLQEENATYAKINNQLFLRAGASESDSELPPTNIETPPPKKSYDDLFK